MNTTEAVVDNNIYNVWSDNLSGNNEIFIAVSTNGGKSFTDPKNISNNPGSSENPVIAVSGNAVYVVWSESTSDTNEILFVKRTDAGNNFTVPENISNNAGSSENPSIAVSGNNVYVAWSNSASNSEILFIKSTNSGNNFTVPKNISNNPGSSENPVIAVSGNAVYVAWSDNTSGNRPDCSSAKANPDKLQNSPTSMMPINIIGVTDPDGENISLKVDSITQDEPTKRTAGDTRWPDGDGNGTSNAKVRAEREGGNDGRVYRINFTASDSSGATCSGSVSVGVPKGNQLIDSGQKYDSTQPSQLQLIDNNNIQNIRSVNTSDSGNNEILFVKSTNAGDNFTDPENISNNAGSSENPSIAVSGNAVYVAWSNSASNSEILFIKSTNAGGNFTDPENISNNAGTSENPVIAVSGNTVYVVWIDNTSGNNQVPIAVSQNGGENFSTPIIISTNAEAISNPQITISGDNVSITWIDNSSGTNKIVIAESTDGGDKL